MADTLENIRSALRTKFDKLTPEDFTSVQGDKDGLVGKVAEKYGISKEEATKQIEEVFGGK